ncbi:MAG: DNA repair protein RecO [Alphaproteobacteria bacterium]|nr:DNA repair protein RecO [Alphaproteobacteria bacterium]
MEWNDDGLILAAQTHGEHAALVHVMTAQHGCYAGLVPGGQGSRMQPVLQTGNHVKLRWRARLAEHLGTYQMELATPFAARWLDNTEVLALINSAAAVTQISAAERQPMQMLYDALAALLSLEDQTLWAPAYVSFEIGLLHVLGYGMDFSCCAVTGAQKDLTHVSPRTGRAVSRETAMPYQDRLLPLPSFLCGTGVWDTADILKGLDLTGHFLKLYVFAHPQQGRLIAAGASMPFARQRLVDFYRNRLEKEASEIAQASKAA